MESSKWMKGFCLKTINEIVYVDLFYDLVRFLAIDAAFDL